MNTISPPTSTMSRKRTRSTNVSETNNDHEQATSTSTIVSSHSTNTTPPKRQRNNPPSRTNDSPRNRSVTPNRRHSSTRLPSRDTSINSQGPRQARRQNLSVVTTIVQQEQPAPPVSQPRQYRLVHISDEDDQSTTATQSSANIVNTTFNLVTDDEDDASIRPQAASHRIPRSTSGTDLNTRSLTTTDPSAIRIQKFPTTSVAHVRLNRAIEIVIQSIQSLEGVVDSFDQLVFGLTYGK